MEKLIFRALLNKEFFDKYKNLVKKDMLGKGYGQLYDILVEAHSKSPNTKVLTTKELKGLYKTIKVLTPAAEQLLERTIEDVDKEEEPSQDLMGELIVRLYNKYTARRGCDLLVETMDTGIVDEAGLSTIFSEFTRNAAAYESTDLSLERVLEETKTENYYKLGIPSLDALIPGLAPERVMTIWGRTECGKSSLAAFMTQNFLKQNLKVIYLGNEEPIDYILLNILRSMFKRTTEELRNDLQSLRGDWNKYSGNLFLYDAVGFSVSDIHALANNHSPHILVIDQTDKITLESKENQDWIRLKNLYMEIRNLAKVHKMAVINITQANEEGEGKRILGLNTMAGSRTDKGAEIDVAIGIGMNPLKDFDEEESPIRFLHVPKNKITGKHGTIITNFNQWRCQFGKVES